MSIYSCNEPFSPRLMVLSPRAKGQGNKQNPQKTTTMHKKPSFELLAWAEGTPKHTSSVAALGYSPEVEGKAL